MPVGSWFRSVASHTAAFAIVALVGIGFLAVSGYDLTLALAALWRGSLGSADAFVSSTLVRAIPLIILGTAVSLAFRVGVFNIGGDGQLLAGAAAATWVALALPAPAPLLLITGLLAGALGGAIWGWLPAILLRRWGVFEVLSTLMLNFMAVQLVSYLVRGPLQEPSRIYPQSSSVPVASQLAILITDSRLHAGIVVALVSALVAWIWLFFRENGFRARLTGANPLAAESAGLIDTKQIKFRVFIVGAALGGVAGAVEVLGVSFALYENLSPGYGFTAIAVALLAGLHPLAIVPSAFLISALDAGAITMQREAGVPTVTAWVVQALLVLAILAVRSTTSRRGWTTRLPRREQPAWR